MNESELHNLRFPIGEFSNPERVSSSDLENWIEDIREFPELVKTHTQNLSSEELSWKYRPDGWNIKQLVHHCVDSHLNAWSRFKLALTEDNPAIRPYFEDRWANLPEANLDDISDSLLILEALHRKWVRMLEFMSEEDMNRTYFHPEYNDTFALFQVLANYAWHCKHHEAHIRQALSAQGKYN